MNEHARSESAHVLDPAYLAGLEDGRSTSCGRSTPSASSWRPRCRTCAGSRRPASTSSKRSSTGARAASRSRSSSNELPQILADPGPRGNPASSRLPLQMAPEQDSEWAPDLEQFDALLTNLPTLSDTELDEAIVGLRSLEREVSDQRREPSRRDRPHRPVARRAAALTDASAAAASPGRADRIVGAMQQVAMLSVHTSPLAQPGTGDGGGMNVYVRALGSALARAGVAVDVLTRAEHPEQPPCRRRRARLPGAARRRGPVRAGSAARPPGSGRRVHRRAHTAARRKPARTTCCTRTTGCRAPSVTG